MSHATTAAAPTRNLAAPQRVQEVVAPLEARRLSRLGCIDYADAVLVDIAPLPQRSAEGWARAVLEGCPSAVQASLSRGWTALGLRRGPSDAPDRVLGWAIGQRLGDAVVLEAASRVGMPAELLFQLRGDRLLFATFVRHDNPLVRLVWAGVIPTHRRTVRHLLARASNPPRQALGRS